MIAPRRQIEKGQIVASTLPLRARDRTHVGTRWSTHGWYAHPITVSIIPTIVTASVLIWRMCNAINADSRETIINKLRFKSILISNSQTLIEKIKSYIPGERRTRGGAISDNSTGISISLLQTSTVRRIAIPRVSLRQRQR